MRLIKITSGLLTAALYKWAKIRVRIEVN